MTNTEPRSAGSGGGRDKAHPTPTELLALARRLDSEATALTIFQGRVEESSDVSIMREAASQFHLLATTLSAREDGWQLVPVVITPEMEDAADMRDDDEPLSDWGKSVDASRQAIWTAMLAAAPRRDE